MTGAVPVSGDDSTRTRLAEAMSVQHGCDTLLSTSGKPCNRCRQSADALLPVVESIAAERAAEALEEAAHHLDDGGDESIEVALGGAAYVHRVLCDRAASLRAASRGETQ